ncbi:MAG TPA: orotidine-5'-phosphate decarboxylase [Acidimicrobiia bacterium]|nr:orotidine-5'-phosphate decarboxylase [Acidimicrobiia bacterium]
MVNPVIVALDVSGLDEALELAGRLHEEVGGFKVGMELLMASGPVAIASIGDLGRPVFVDAKLHDIPNTVERAAARIRAAGARWVTIHASGGKEMAQAAVSGMQGEGVLAVTMLTSLGEEDLAGIGVNTGLTEYVTGMAGLAAAAGVEGVVCSPGEIREVKSAQPGLKVFTPGVRPEDSTRDDQKRVATPGGAVADGADYLVIGRPITRAPDPVAAAREIVASLTATVR